jgi:hypothetical protein
MSLTFGLSPLLLVALMAVAGLAAWWMYRQTVPQLPAGIRIVLGAIRFGVLATILFLLAEPILRRAVDREQPPVFAVLVDASGSMALSPDEGGGAPAADEARRVVEALERGLDGVDVRWFGFGAELTDLGAAPHSDSLRFAMGRTDIADALSTASQRLLGQGLTSVILVSDGRHNSGRNPLSVAERFPVPVHTVAVGDTLTRADVQVRSVETNDLAYRGRELPFRATIRHEGFGGQTVEVVLQEDGVAIDRATLTLPDGDGATPVELKAVPTEAGLRRYTVAVTVLDGELTGRNNSASVAVRVLESQRRILVLAAGPSPDLASLRTLLERDPDLAVETRVQKSASEFYEGPLPDLDPYDLLVLVGYPGRGASPDDVDRIAAAAGQGTPIFFALDRRTDQQALSRMAAVLPANPETVRPGFTEARVLPTAEGRRHPVLTAEVPAAADPWSVVPPLLVPDSRFAATPDAQVLAVPEIRGIGLDDPVLVTRRRSGMRSAALLATGFWRWSNLPDDLDSFSDAWPGTVERLVQWLVAPEDDRPVRVRPVSESFEGGTEVEFTGQVYDEALVPVPDGTIELRVTTPDGRTLPYTLRPVGAGRYAGSLGVLPEGTYAYAARGLRDDVELGEDSGTFAVGPLSVEFMDPGSDPAVLRQVSARSGGVAVDASGAASLVDSLDRRGLLRPSVRTAEVTFRLWQRFPFLVLVLVLLTLEWFLRKRRGLV